MQKCFTFFGIQLLNLHTKIHKCIIQMYDLMIDYYILNGSGSSQRSLSPLSSFWLDWEGGKRGWYWCFRDGRGRIGGKGWRWGRHIQCNFMEIHYNFWLFFFYHLSKKYLYSAPVPLPLFALVLVPVSSKHPCRKRSQKQSWKVRTLLLDCLISVSFLALLPCLALVQNTHLQQGAFC